MIKDVNSPGVSYALPSMVNFPPYHKTINIPTIGKNVEHAR